MRGKNKTGVQGPKTASGQVEVRESGGEHDNDKVADTEIQKVPKTRRAEVMRQGERQTKRGKSGTGAR
jgi:hypothetical protein